LPAAPAAGAQKLDPQFHAILCQCRVKPEHIAALGDADCDSSAVFGPIAKTEETFYLYIKRILNVDPDARGEDAVPAARLFMAWEVCRKRTEVETEATAQRAVNRMPVQLAIDVFQSARDAFERKQGRVYVDHKIPSENYFEKKVGEMESSLKAEKLSSVSNFAQEERQRTLGTTPGWHQDFDTAGRGILKVNKKDFYVAMPKDESTLKNRFEVVGAMLEMMKMRFMANPILATAALELTEEYAE
jgi:hypothetical protein